MHNTTLAKWRAGHKTRGLWLMLPETHVVEVLMGMDFDWACFDLQHGLLDYVDLPRLLPATNGSAVTPLVRVAANAPDQIGKALDAGAQGVIVPLVNDVADARRAVAACRYPPAGVRSCGPIRASLRGGSDYLARANQEIACVLMIETAEGLANVTDIASVPGVDGLFIGPMDLCYGLGLAPGQFDDPRFEAAIQTIVRACRTHGIAPGMFGYSPEDAAARLAADLDFASIGTDIGFLRAGAQAALARAAEQPDAPAGGGPSGGLAY